MLLVRTRHTSVTPCMGEDCLMAKGKLAHNANACKEYNQCLMIKQADLCCLQSSEGYKQQQLEISFNGYHPALDAMSAMLWMHTPSHRPTVLESIS